MSTYRLIAQACLLRDKLEDRGYPYLVEEVEDTLLSLAREFLPESVAAQWDAEWAHDLCKDTLAHLAGLYAGLPADKQVVLDLSAQEAWDKQMVTAGLDNNPVAFRKALKGWERSGIEAVERVRVNEGGAA